MNIRKRGLSLVLALIMVVSMLPLQANAAATHSSHPLCGSSCDCSSDNHGNLNWIAWDGTTRMYSNSNYYLTKDVVLNSTLILDYAYDTALCLNGHSITCEDRVFDIYSYRRLWITDCVGTGVIETTGNDCTIGNNKYLSVWGGTIRNSSDWGPVIESYNGTTTYVCGGTVESEGYAAIDAMAGSKVYIQGGTVRANTDGGNFVIDSMGREGYTSNLSVSGGTISYTGYNPNGINWIGGNFTMSGGVVNGNVDTSSVSGGGATTISGGTINGELYTSHETLSITGGQMQLYSLADSTTISAGAFKENCNISGSSATISAGNFSDCDVLNLAAPTWIYGGTYNQINVNDQMLYLSGLPSIEKLKIKKPNTVSAKNKDNSGSYAGDPIQIELDSSTTWRAGDVVVKNVSTDALAQKFVLADDGAGLRYLERSGSNLVLRTIPGGSCGPSATWKYQNGVLTISGTGGITREGEGRLYPWGDYVDDITRVIV